jgi:hypothetical protein
MLNRTLLINLIPIRTPSLNLLAPGSEGRRRAPSPAGVAPYVVGIYWLPATGIRGVGDGGAALVCPPPQGTGGDVFEFRREENSGVKTGT